MFKPHPEISGRPLSPQLASAAWEVWKWMCLALSPVSWFWLISLQVEATRSTGPLFAMGVWLKFSGRLGAADVGHV